ncbi:MAG: transcription elongation factor Spt5 [Candidatus Altiarchaeales archaeon A3]|nr:MAG: transcription elongation factor Spt5 [Candidatus Altiarchaeales archaeon A3]
MIFALKVTQGQERIVAEMFYNEAKKLSAGGTYKGIYSVAYVTTQRGYIFIEAEKDNYRSIEEMAKTIPKTGQLVGRKNTTLKVVKGKKTDKTPPKPVLIEELENIMFPKKIVAFLNTGDFVEVVNGPFKGERARVIKVNKEKNDVTIELTESAVPIPITVKGSDLRALSKDSR